MPNYEDVKFMYGPPRGTYKGYDRRPNESWDQFIVRKMGEERREEVYPVREDVPSDLWGKPIAKKSDIQSEHSSVGDMVNHPPHYNKGIETTKYIKSWEMNWNQANVIKYVSRYNLKNKNDVNIQIQDLMKAKWYLEDLIRELEKYNPY